MANKKLSVQDFAAKIKAKYPQYKNVDDTELTGKVLQKYPTYSQSVDYNPQQDQATDPLAGPLRSLGLGAVSDMANAPLPVQMMGPGGSAIYQATKNPAQGLGDVAGLGAWATGAGEEMAGAKIASTIPGLLGKVAGNAVPRFVSGALQGASQPGANPASIAESGGINVGLGPVGNALGKLQSSISLGKAGPALQDITKATGKPVVGGYQTISKAMGKAQESLQNKINSIYDRSGGLSRKDAHDVLQSVFNQPGNQWLKVNKGVQDWITNTFAPIVKEAGDQHFKDQIAKGAVPNHIVQPDFVSTAAGPGSASTMGGQATKGGIPGSTREVVNKSQEGAQRVGPSNTFTKGEFATPQGQAPENQPGAAGSSAQTGAQTGNPPSGFKTWEGWMNSPFFKQFEGSDTSKLAQAWGEQSTQIPLHVWDSVVKNLGDEAKGAFGAARNGAMGTVAPEQQFASKVYHAMQQKMMTRMAPQDAVDYASTKAMKNKAYVIQKHADLTTSGKINPLKTLGKGGGGLVGMDALAHGALTQLAGAGAGALAGGYALTRPAVTTAMQSPVGKGIMSSLGRLGGAGVSNFFSGNQNQ